ncbi:DUF2336 domain-containing protein [Methylorubrum populi]|uniref:DUF2336 domain-containing protein n=1 Tax=Methylorubrum populi TaxID=223967 RepID=UPI003F65808F
MSSLAELVDTVEQTLRTVDASHHRRMLLGVTDLLVGLSASLSNVHWETFDEVLGRLVSAAEVDARQAVAEHVGTLAQAPPGLVRQLVADKAGLVAGPILRSRIALSDAVLIHVAQSRSQDHLAAIAQRTVLSEPVCEAVAAKGNDAVLRILLANAGAQLSSRALFLMATRFEDEATLTAGLAQRMDLLPRQRAELLRERRYERARARMNGGAPQAWKGSKAEAAVALRIKIGLDDGDVQHWLSNGRTTEALLALAHLARIPADHVFAAHASADLRRLTLFVRCAGLGTATLARLICTVERPEARGDLGRILSAFRALSVEQARAALEQEALIGEA